MTRGDPPYARDLRLISSPFDSGVPDVGMGAGAAELAADAELRAVLDRQGWRTTVDTVPAVGERMPEIARVIELDRRLAVAVRTARANGAFPLVLAGNCNSSLGTVAGVSGGTEAPVGVVWFDAHADFDGPDENLSGFFDVMALSILTGGSWAALAATIPGFRAVPEARAVLAAVRDLEPYQRAALERSEVVTVPGAFAAADLERSLDGLRADVDRVYLHLDLDALDAREGRPNAYAAEDGPGLAELERAIDAVFARFAVVAAALTAYDPAADTDGRAGAAARRLVARMAARAFERAA